jgi:hypothetical protein|tara:strand:+ start:337 stop:507 length:171 start_codon:yes stop_codon:yes gene_type:complete
MEIEARPIGKQLSWDSMKKNIQDANDRALERRMERIEKKLDELVYSNRRKIIDKYI